MMESLIQQWDGEAVIIHHDKPTDAWIFIAVHSTRLGPATGGTRMKPYANPSAGLQDAMRLSAAMTYKFAVPAIPRGGGKAVIALPQKFDSTWRPGLLRRYGALIRQLGGLYYTGPDVGTGAEDMDVVAETGAPYVFCRTPACGGAGDSGPITALGVFTGIQVVCELLYGNDSLKGRRVVVQGVGSVGRTLVDFLTGAGAEVLFTDVNEAVVHHYREKRGLKFVPAETIYQTEGDIFSPCALGGILNSETIPQLRCRGIAGGANNQLSTPEDAVRLRDRGILYAPDYVVNVGGAMAIPGIEIQGWSLEKAEKEVSTSVRAALRRIFELSASEGVTTDAAARRIAEENLRKSKDVVG